MDAEGNVTYSSVQVPQAVSSKIVYVRPGPTPEEAEAARARMEVTEKAADELAREREKRRMAPQRKAGDQASLPRTTPEPSRKGSEGFVHPNYPAQGRPTISEPTISGDQPLAPEPPADVAPLPAAPDQ